MNNPELIEVARQNTAAESVKQVIHHVDKKRKRELLSFLIGSQNWKQVLVFTRTKHGANRLAGQLQKDGLNSSAIHGNKSQGARTKALTDFKMEKFGFSLRPTSPPEDWTSTSSPCRQFRTSQCCRRLHSPHRPYRSRRP